MRRKKSSLMQLKPGQPRVAIYARYSPRPKAIVGEHYTIGAQLDACHELAAREFPGLPIDEFVDKEESGKDLDRPGLDRLRDAVRDLPYKGVVVYVVDRLAREVHDLTILGLEFEKQCTKLIFVNGGIYDSTPEGIFAFKMMGVVGELQRNQIKDRTRRGRKEKATKGFVHSAPPPYGYRYMGHKDGHRGLYQVIEAQAEVVRAIFALATRGMSNYETALGLNKQGIPTQKGGKWWRQSIVQVLSKTAHYGEVTGPNDIVIKVPPTLSEDRAEARAIWETAHAIQDRNLVARVGRPSNNYLLTGFLWCSACGHRAYTFNGKGLFYRCGHLDGPPPKQRLCHAPGVAQYKLDTGVWDAIWDTITQPDLLWQMIEAYHDRVAVKAAAPKDGAMLRIDRARRALARMEAILLDPDIHITDAKGKLKAAQRELLEAETALPAPVLQMPLKAEVVAISREFQQFREQVSDFNIRRGLLKRVVSKIRWDGYKREAEVTCGLPFPGQKNCNRDGGVNFNSLTNYPFVITVKVAA